MDMRMNRRILAIAIGILIGLLLPVPAFDVVAILRTPIPLPPRPLPPPAPPLLSPLKVTIIDDGGAHLTVTSTVVEVK
jgi:hypothetical protein